MDDNELIQWYKRVFDEYPSVGLLAFIREVMEQAAPVNAEARVDELEAAVVALYDGLNERDNCRICGGDGTHWTAINGEAEADNCECADEAYRLLLAYGDMVMQFRRKDAGDGE